MKRIFTAVDISAEAREKAKAYTENLRRAFPALRVGWERPEKLHLTLKFLGDTSDDQLELLKEAAARRAAEFTRFGLRLARTGVFPSARKARVLWLGVEDEQGSLLRLNEMLETECENLGFPRETRSFSPHLTIARLKDPASSRDLIARHLQSEFEPIGFSVAEIVIYESKLQPTGSIYQKVAAFRLPE